jgi:hypothetical protein
MDDRLDAAQALLGVSPSSSSFFPLSSNSSSFGKFGAASLNNNLEHHHGPATTAAEPSDTDTLETASLSTSVDSQQSLESPLIIVRRPRSNSAGLDALAFLATKEQASLQSQEQEQQQLSFGGANNHPLSPRVPLVVVSSPKTNNGPEVPLFVASAISSSSSSSSSDEDDSEAMPPPPPRSSSVAVVTGRRRSVSNPEGMEKWAPTNNMSTTRLKWMLPASILEEEMAEASAAIKAQKAKRVIASSSFSFPRRKRGGKPTTALDEDDLTTLQEEEEEDDDDDEEEEEEEEDEANLSQDELLRRARSRLLEDLSESNLTGEKGIMTLPHSLDKYKEVRFISRFSRSP